MMQPGLNSGNEIAPVSYMPPMAMPAYYTPQMPVSLPPAFMPQQMSMFPPYSTIQNAPQLPQAQAIPSVNAIPLGASDVTSLTPTSRIDDKGCAVEDISAKWIRSLRRIAAARMAVQIFGIVSIFLARETLKCQLKSMYQTHRPRYEVFRRYLLMISLHSALLVHTLFAFRLIMHQPLRDNYSTKVSYVSKFDKSISFRDQFKDPPEIVLFYIVMASFALSAAQHLSISAFGSSECLSIILPGVNKTAVQNVIAGVTAGTLTAIPEVRAQLKKQKNAKHIFRGMVVLSILAFVFMCMVLLPMPIRFRRIHGIDIRPIFVKRTTMNLILVTIICGILGLIGGYMNIIYELARKNNAQPKDVAMGTAKLAC